MHPPYQKVYNRQLSQVKSEEVAALYFDFLFSRRSNGITPYNNNNKNNNGAWLTEQKPCTHLGWVSCSQFLLQEEYYMCYPKSFSHWWWCCNFCNLETDGREKRECKKHWSIFFSLLTTTYKQVKEQQRPKIIKACSTTLKDDDNESVK